MTVRELVDSVDHPAGRRFNLMIQALILLSMLTFSLETLPGLPAWIMRLLWAIEVLTVAVFTVEYVLRIWAARQRWRFVLSFYGLIDLIAIVPFYLSLGLDLRSLRIVRLLRLLRLLKLMRYNRALQRFRRALVLAREEILLFMGFTLGLLYLAAMGIYFFEHDAQPDKFKSVFHSLWWAVSTLTTVGYGDVYPITTGGRMFTFFVLMIGLGIVAVPTGLITSALTRTHEEERADPEEAEEAQTAPASAADAAVPPAGPRIPDPDPR